MANLVIGLILLAVVLAVAGLGIKCVDLSSKVEDVERSLGTASGLVERVIEHVKNLQNIIINKPKKLFYYSASGDLKRAHSTDAGMDIMSAENYTLKPRERHLFSTGIYGILPKGTGVIVKPRSGLAVKFGIDVLAGVVDEGYTGHIKVLLVNHGEEDFKVEIGDKIAQLLLMDVYQTQPEKISENMYNIFKENKDRLDKGFGSSGMKDGEADGRK